MIRILLDECVDERLRHLFAEHDCQTARYAGFAVCKTGLCCSLPKRLVSMCS